MLELVLERAQLVVDDVEDQVGVDAEVLVYDDVAKSGDCRPGNVWNACAGFGSEAAHGFSDDREVSQYRVVGHRCVLLGAQAGSVLLTSVDGVDDVGEALFV